MAITIIDEHEVRLEPLLGKRVAVLGYGNQGQAHALNLRDSGVEVTVGQRGGASFDRASADGFKPEDVSKAAAGADLIILALPDEMAAKIYDQEIKAQLAPGKTLGFIHGFNVRYGFIDPPSGIDVIMVAPKGPGTLLRSLFQEGRGLPSLLAIERDYSNQARGLALAWAAGIGSGRAAVVETTFASETETDLFGEQAVLCGGVTALCKAAFETLVEAGYEPEFAYLECVHELKQIADLIYERGISAMRQRISNTAEYGDLTRGPKLIGPSAREEMKRILAEVQDGTFAKEWIAEAKAGLPRFKSLHEADANSQIEQAGQAVRRLMPWLSADEV